MTPDGTDYASGGNEAPRPSKSNPTALIVKAVREELAAAGYAIVPVVDRAVAVRWRTGRKVGRTIYAMVGPEASDDDVLIGVMDTRLLADEAVKAHNQQVSR